MDAYNCVKGAIYLEAFKLFPDKKFHEIEAITLSLVGKVLRVDDESTSEEETLLINTACEDGALLSTIADAHQLLAFRYSIYANIFKSFGDMGEEERRIANEYDSKSEYVTYDNFKKYQKKYKLLHKKLKKRVKRHQKNQIKNEVWEKFSRVKFSLSNFTIVTSIVSILLYFGGFVYAKILYYSLGSDSTQYLGIIDYFVAGLNSTTSALLMIFIGGLMCIGIFHDINLMRIQDSHYYPTGTEPESSLEQPEVTKSAINESSVVSLSRTDKLLRFYDFIFIFGAVLLVAFLAFISYQTGSGFYKVVITPLAMIIPIAVGYSGVLNLFDRPMLAFAFIWVVVNFSLTIISDGYGDAEKILAGNCPNESKIELQQKIRDKKDSCLIGTTSSWVIEYDNESGLVNAYPRENVSVIR